MPEATAAPPTRTGRLRLLAHLTWWDLVAQYFGSWVGLLWNVIMPLVVIGVYLAVFELSPHFRFGGYETVGGYGINLVAGLIPWLLFQEAVTRAANAFVDQRHLLTQVPLPPALFPLASVGSALLRHLFAGLAFAVILFASGILPTPLWVLLLAPLAVLLLLSASLAVLVALHRDTQPAVIAIMLPLFFTTPIIYPPHIVPSAVRVLMDLNPLTPIVAAYRDLLVTGRMPLWGDLLWAAAVAGVFAGMAALLVRRVGPELAERL